MKSNKKFDVEDPAYYDSLIANQKRRACKFKGDAHEWLELGRLHDAKIGMTNHFARRSFVIRYFIFIYGSLILLFTLFSIFITPHLLSLPPLQLAFPLIGYFLLLIGFPYLWSMRYPPSGSKYFKKAISINPECADAHMYLGLIALRRYQKRKGCRLLEEAIRLGVDKGRIEKQLKSIYEKEFVAFFHKIDERSAEQQIIIERQLKNIGELGQKIASLEKWNQSLVEKLNQVKWRENREKNLFKRDMNAQIDNLRDAYEEKIVSMESKVASLEEDKEQAENHLLRLTVEIMEGKAGLAGRSLGETTSVIEKIMGKENWLALSEQTKIYLATAEHTFNLFKNEGENPDYSLVGMELCKALETELNKRLVEPFIEYLNGKKTEFLRVNQNGENKGKPTYFTYLARVVDDINYPQMDSLTLGQYLFVLKLAFERDYALHDYINFLSEKCNGSGGILGRGFLEKLEIVTQRYRNAIAHQSPMVKEEYESLRTFVFNENEALLKVIANYS